MATFEIEEAKVVSLLQEACVQHELFLQDSLNGEAVVCARTYAEVISVMFKVDLRDVPHIVEDVISSTPRMNWGFNLWQALSIKANRKWQSFDVSD